MTLESKLKLLGIKKAKQIKIERAKFLSNDNGKFVRIRGQKFPLESGKYYNCSEGQAIIKAIDEAVNYYWEYKPIYK
jgi:hypothetical protein|tara:strand:+ start:1092 stop:1322 length:231 start_codon:yes stop_codon:yes gene_type:complete